MIYLSKLELDISAPGVRQCLANAQDMHRSIMRPFGATRSDASLLYRLVSTPASISLYVQSCCLPDWSILSSYGFQCSGIKDISRLPELYKDGAVLHYSLVAYPSKKVKGESKNSSRIPIYAEVERAEWLRHQAEKYGFAVCSIQQNSLDNVVCNRKGSGCFSITPVEFKGVLTITDASAFWKAFTDGIGAEKAYGMGMLMLSKA